MKRSISLVILSTLGISSSVIAQSWCEYEDDGYGYYEEPIYEVVLPLHELIFGLIRGHLERPEHREIRRPVWEEPGWVAPRAQRPPTLERKDRSP